ncbi:PspC domain-containing protein [Lutimonas zeaxanthinifaciens]|uniref:PspC domain-containing protein n=1 Tax=Lutimonas zeaxanthinifaciens TaxID=3060215 RepID=UPI00265D5FB2|nr:PspC domain-containing protein [Lutimonas sp. YSD2104]WKK66964.1 PspC domain-containing protein [Lutimonas sp. YSD2104]
MNKTININLGGVFFHIDEIAYQKLKSYLDAIRRSLSDDPKGRDEIITDIESRIGELLSDKVKDVRQVVNQQDIDEVIDVMGKPEDYMVDDEIFSDDSYSSYTRKRPRKLYRDGSDRFLGGVSSGMAHYLNVDVIWIRLGWLVAAFGFGFGFIVYPLLWILLPEANTTAEKLEMEGAEVNISNIEKKIRDEITDASHRVKNGIDEVSEKVKNADYKKYGERAKSGSQDLVDTLGKIFVTLFMIIGKFIGVLLIIVAVSTILALLIGLFTLGSLDFIHEDWIFQNSMIYNNSGLPVWVISILTFVLVGIPFFFLFALGLRILSNNTKSIGKTAKLSLLGVWIVALLVAIFFGTRQVMNSAYDGSITNTQELYFDTTDTLEIKMVDNQLISNRSELKRHWRSEIIVDTDNQEKLYSNNIRFNILASDNETMYAKVRKESQGRSRKDARDNADLISHGYELDGDALRFDGYFLAELNNRSTEQRIYIDLYLPEGQTVYLDNSTRSFLYDVDNIQGVYDNDMAKHHFQMTREGFNCLDCSDDEVNTWSDDDSFNMKINGEGVHIEIQEEGQEKSEVKIDGSGVVVTKAKDSV